MAITLGPKLGGILLAGLKVPDEWEFTGVRSVVATSVGGTPNIWEGPVGGRIFVIYGGQNTGVLKKPVIDSVYELSRVIDAVYEFDPGDGNVFDVKFAHHEPRVIIAERIGNVLLPDETTYFNNIQIKLMRI